MIAHTSFFFTLLYLYSRKREKKRIITDEYVGNSWYIDIPTKKVCNCIKKDLQLTISG